MAVLLNLDAERHLCFLLCIYIYIYHKFTTLIDNFTSRHRYKT